MGEGIRISQGDNIGAHVCAANMPVEGLAVDIIELDVARISTGNSKIDLAILIGIYSRAVLCFSNKENAFITDVAVRFYRATGDVGVELATTAGSGYISAHTIG